MSKRHRLLTRSQTRRVEKAIRPDWLKIQAFRILFPEADTVDINVDMKAGTMAIPIRIAREITKHHCL